MSVFFQPKNEPILLQPALKMDDTPRVAIVSTMKGPEYMLESWLLWHGGLGIRDFYLCFDDPNDSAISIAERYSTVYTVRSNVFLVRFICADLC